MNKNVRITEEQLQIILDKNYENFAEKILTNCLCNKCMCVVKIVDYKIFLNDLYDVILKGNCAICGARVSRYIETGEDKIAVKKIKKTLKNISGHRSKCEK